jgi:hypothetical protein
MRGSIRQRNSPWPSPIVLAPKKDGDYRFCIDFRRVNSATKKDVQPMSRIDDILFTQTLAILDLARFCPRDEATRGA